MKNEKFHFRDLKVMCLKICPRTIFESNTADATDDLLVEAPPQSPFDKTIETKHL